MNIVRRRQALRRIAATFACAASISTDARAADEREEVYLSRFRLGFVNPSGHTLGPQQLWCYLPASLGAAQTLLGASASHPMALKSDALGHNYGEILLTSVAPYARVYIGFEARVRLTSETAIAGAPDPWLRPERFIESDNADIVSLAGILRRPQPRRTAESIYDWVSRNLSYAGYLADDLGASHALLHRRGDCTEYAYLVAALARAAGIPARMVGGYVQAQDRVLRPADYHDWAEVLIEGRWEIVDAQRGSLFPAGSSYLRFRFYRDVATNPIGLAHRYALRGELRPIDA